MPSTTIGICLFELPEKDQAVIQRVITFGASQGKHYNLQTEASSAQIIIALDSTALPPDHQAVTIRIGEADKLSSDLLLQRPLLVTRVMRTIDEAAQLYRSRPASPPQEQENSSSKNQPINTPLQSEEQSEPAKVSDISQTSNVPESITADKQEIKSSEIGLDNNKETVTTIKTDTKTEYEESSTATPEIETPLLNESAPPNSDQTQIITTHPEAATSIEALPPTEGLATLEKPAHTEEEEETNKESIAETEEGEDYSHLALVVDDSAAIRKQLEIELRNAHIKADFAETGEEALEMSAQTQYDLVFLDIIMPGIDGYEVCRQMRARKAMKKTPIIMLSAKTSPLDEVQGVIAGASTYLTKPVKHEQFQQTLKRVSKWLSEFAR